MCARVSWGICCAVIVTLAATPVLGVGEEVAPGLKVGDVVDQSNWQLAKDLFPPEILRHYERGEYRNRIVANPKEPEHWDATFVAATRENPKYLDVNERGSIIDKRTGEQPPRYYGFPFPNIDANDPNAGVKVVWNLAMAYWHVGSAHYYTQIVLLNPKGIDREVVPEVYWKLYDGQGPRLTPEENPLNLSMQQVSIVVKPADVNGTAQLGWRYRDEKRDSFWTYVPALRRVRALSPANRSDGFLGSDISADDGNGFDGKPEDFTWKLVGQREGLVFGDPVSLETDNPPQPWKEGGWIIMTDPDLPTAGFRTPGWTGVAWAPTDPVLVKRKMWVVEGVPRDKFYLYGKLELWIDAETWYVQWSRKYAWNGELLQNYQTCPLRNHAAGPPEAREWAWTGATSYFCVEALKYNRASCAGFRPFPGAAFARRVPLDASLFDPAKLNRWGK